PAYIVNCRYCSRGTVHAKLFIEILFIAHCSLVLFIAGTIHGIAGTVHATLFTLYCSSNTVH
ncbi:hypothetical protein A2U01_0103397, partial [Trifolium medium]|nr:hypothetical protein [Trifolium medium]